MLFPEDLSDDVVIRSCLFYTNFKALATHIILQVGTDVYKRQYIHQAAVISLAPLLALFVQLAILAH